MSGAAAPPRRSGGGKVKARLLRIGLALAGGGPLGGIYEIGALLALSESLDGLEIDDLDVYVGVSSGGFVAAALANGISPAQMYRLFIEDGAEGGLSASLFLRPALGEFARRALSVPRLLAEATAVYLRHPWRGSVLDACAALGRAIPTGVFDQRALDAFLRRLFKSGNRSDDFRQLPRQLFLVATDLDSGTSVTFGGAGTDHVPISKALQASAALPGLFPPVCINGRQYVDGALTRRCTPRSLSTVACDCCCASTRWFHSMRAPRLGTAARQSRSSTMADCLWCSPRHFERSSIHG